MTARRRSGIRSVVALIWLSACAGSPRPVQPSGSAGVSAAEDEAMRAHPPPPEQAFAVKLPDPYAATLPNGMKLIVLERHALRVAAIDLVVRGAPAGPPHGSPAIARLMSDTMPFGTKRFGEVQIFQALNENAIQMFPHVTDTWLGVKLRAASSRLDPALRILHDIALEPTFPPEAVDVARRRLIADELGRPDQPAVAARRNLFAALYGLHHPYTAALAPLAHDLETVSRDDVARFWRTAMDPARTTLVVAGDVDPVVVRQSVATLFGGWARDPAAPDRLAVAVLPAARGSTRIVAVDRPGAVQATIFYGGQLPDDSIAARASRALIQDLVDQDQTRANASQGQDPTATWKPLWHFPAGILWWQTQVPAAQASAAVRRLDGWLRQLRERGPDAKDLEAARRRATRLYPGIFETVEWTADVYAEVAGADLPLDSINKFQTSAATLLWGQIRPALPADDQMRLVVVGDLKVVMPQLLSMGWGSVQVNDADARTVK